MQSYSDQNEQEPWSLQSLFIFTKDHLFSLGRAVAVTALSSTLHPLSAILCGQIFRFLISYSSGSMVLSEMYLRISNRCIFLVMLGFLSWIIEFGFMSSWIIHGERLVKGVRERLFTTLLYQDIQNYDLREDGFGPLLVRNETLIKEFQSGFSQPMGFVVYEIFGLFFSLAVAFYYSWQLALLILGFIPFMLAALWLVSGILRSVVEEQHYHLLKASKRASASIKASSTVKAHTAQDYEVLKYKESLQMVLKTNMIQARANATQIAVTKFVIAICFIGGFWFGLYMVTYGKDPGNVVIAFYTALAVVQSLEIVSTQWVLLMKGSAASRVIYKLILESQKSQAHEYVSAELPDISNSDIELKKVSFSYPGKSNQYILHDASLIFSAGRTTFIAGRSGSGKSTIGKLLMNFYTVNQGDVLIDGKPIKIFPHEWLYQKIALADQETLLFNETIYQNIAFGRIHSGCREEVINAGEIVDLKAMLRNIPGGLDNLISQCGKSLSGGQRQRVLLSRAKLRDSPILILDEATCALDQISRDKVTAEIRKWRKNKTTVIITHEVSEVLDDEYIYVIDNGLVIEEGIRKSLAEKKNSVFTSLLTGEKNGDDKKITKQGPETSVNLIESGSVAFDSDTSGSKLRKGGFRKEELTDQSPVKSSDDFGQKKNETTPPNRELFSDTILELTSNEIYSGSEPDSFKSNKKIREWLLRWLRKIRGLGDYSPIPNNTVLEAYSLGSIETSSALTTTSIVNGEQDFSSTESDYDSEELTQESSENLGSYIIILSTVWPRLRQKDKLYLIIGIVACFTTAMVTPIFAYLISNLMNVYESTGNQLREGNKWASALLFLTFVDSIVTYLSSYCLECVGEAWVAALRVECLQKIFRQPQAWLNLEKNSPSILAQFLDLNIEEMRYLIGRFVGPVLITFWVIVLSISWSLVINWRLTLAALCCSPLIYVGIFAFNWTASKHEKNCNEMAENASKIFTETMLNFHVIRAFQLESYFEKKYLSAISSIYSAGIRRSVYSGLVYGFVSDTISFTIIAFVIYYGTSLIVGKNLSVLGCFQIVNLLLFGLGHGLTTISLIPQVNSSRAAATKILHLVNLPSNQSHEIGGNLRLLSLFPINLKDLNFTYPKNDSETLKNINMTIRKGSFTVITGPSGSGKSTIASLLLGLYIPDNAPDPTLYFAGAPLELCHLATLRNQMAIVSQDPVIFPDTIFANIAYGQFNESFFAHIEAVKQAAQDAGISEFIENLDCGYNSIIGEGGLGVSLGQAQRIMIARALFRRPKLLILDEATSALDTHSAAQIRCVIQRLRNDPSNDITVVAISHCVRMMAISENIVVLNNGEIVQRGSYEQLWNQTEGPLWKLTGGEGMHAQERIQMGRRIYQQERTARTQV
ncbi:ABC transporter B family member 6 [Golovinomyces cichoracearum]|uniref:ABC transporter B family member 6 n=1 Tax=Golovinomyces cichoracearum TaxID=62708 RepID=A0A420IGT3_9PEZI|nr:ABC transporter B family member 6 [Golovinomyces cichoracearum]